MRTRRELLFSKPMREIFKPEHIKHSLLLRHHLGELDAATENALTEEIVTAGYASPTSSRSVSPTPSELDEMKKDPILRVGVKKIPRPVYLAQLGEMQEEGKIENGTYSYVSDIITAIPEPPAITKQLSRYVLRAQRQFTPYGKPHGRLPNALELRYADRFCGRYPGETDLSLADVQAGKDVLERGVALLSKETLAQIIVAKRAACESMRLRAMTTAWEIQASSEHSKLLELIFKDEAKKFADRAAAVSFMETLVSQNKQELESTIDFHVGAYSHDLTSLAVGDLQLEQIEDLARNLPEKGKSHHDDDAGRNVSESESEFEWDG
ncbi:hypothetical protein C8R48DRAFT_674099 [Suillus tomentosus]|nr:hypothetical protein C8R48DRAFT_674099 [Suillus tomentosus]